MGKKPTRRTVIIVIILLALFLPPFIKYQQLRWRSKKLDSQIVSLNKETKKLATEKNRLQTDIAYVERKAREKIGIAKKGEIILKESPAKK